MSIESIRLSEKAKQQLITLKRRTGISHWNVLCRWAFCLSIREPTAPPNETIPADSSVEMSWKVFAGPYADVFLALLRTHAHQHDVVDQRESELHLLRLHIHRGISYLGSNVTSLPDLFKDIASQP